MIFFAHRDLCRLPPEAYAALREYDRDIRLQEAGLVIRIAWAESLHIHYKIIHGYLCTLFIFEGWPVFFEINTPSEKPAVPLQQPIDELYMLAQKAGLPALEIWCVDERCLADYEAVTGYRYRSAYSDDHCEYVYLPSDIVDLEGSVNKNKRERINRFFATPITFQPIRSENIGQCLTIQDEWCRKQDCAVCRTFSGCEKRALEIMAKLFDPRIQSGVYMYINGAPVGYVIWELRSNNVAFLYFSKALVPNLSVYLYYILAKEYLSNAAYLNLNEDMGKLGLRTFKTHMGRYVLWRKYMCTFEHGSAECA
ncbi:phosphatidylglycerol lysyltransferase domain-containing protein [Treponema endosymbiont of Eucomonympha sp.]|uniref:phosphatidylglycerol lysyltransferase domain-containing protein n=1 Tax=Treponema endosymbiont of Eucomonympha sp. TaxID=1580831 RepID=UPI000783E5A3|nr:phosphatidylglycerol lysyltransferase domain-containing protein [Treponema endosymbiont of Eucomonympha sp.]